MYKCTDVDECDLGIPWCGKLQCQNTVGTYVCGCRQGYVVAESGGNKICADVDECNNRNVCPLNGFCENFDGGYRCTCDSGYQSENCTDIDECSDDKIQTCDRNAACLNTEGTYLCSCNQGFYGSGRTCDRGQCTDASCPVYEKCVSPTTTKCECIENYEKVNGTCQDVDECDLKGICDKNAQCINFPGGHMCDCLSGFYGNGTSCQVGACKDELCPINEECSSPTGLCVCEKGFQRDANSTCIDNDECSKSNQCDENAVCSNSVGSFSCDCNEGFYGTGEACAPGQCFDGACPENQVCKSKTSVCHCPKNFTLVDDDCTDVDECLSPSQYCPVLSSCVNNNGGYECQCYIGYDGFNCTNIDECAIETHTCKTSETCIDTIGSFDCVCADGYKLKNGECEDRDECRMNSTLCEPFFCVNLPGDYLCQGTVQNHLLYLNLLNNFIFYIILNSESNKFLS